jgi:hypothetical protein
VIEKKKKYCSGCESEQYIWKAHLGDKYCKYCWGKIQSKDPDHKVIPQVSAKRKKLDVEYLKLRAKHLEANPLCQVKGPNCTHYATDIHHKFAGANRDAYYLIQSTWLTVCRADHSMIHENPAKARTMGWLK